MSIPTGAIEVDAVPNGAVMTLTIDTSTLAPGVLLLWGQTTDGLLSWWVRGARGGTPYTPGDILFLTDPMCPLNVDVQYTLEVTGGETATSSVVRRNYDGGDHLFTNINGGDPVGFEWRDDGNPWSPVTRGAEFAVAGRDNYVVRYARPLAGRRTVPAGTVGTVNTAKMRDVVRSGEPVICLHNRALCEVECDVDLVVLGWPNDVSATRTDAVMFAERLWDISLTLMDDPLADVITPLSTVADFDAEWSGSTVAMHDAEWASETVGEHSRVLWSA